ncbi:MAG: PilZ domain-containing protein [Deltaproteobacteria bacterium]|nr:PilZ domain-containing protein [Deltaproteobacteria bacterium]
MVSGDRRKQDRRQKQTKVTVERRAQSRRQIDRRSTKRIPLELWMEEVAGDDVYFRRSGNIGEGGVYFDKVVPHVIGTMVTLKFALPGEHEMIVARGEVVSNTSEKTKLGMRVKFIAIEGDGRRRLRDFITRAV